MFFQIPTSLMHSLCIQFWVGTCHWSTIHSLRSHALLYNPCMQSGNVRERLVYHTGCIPKSHHQMSFFHPFLLSILLLVRKTKASGHSIFSSFQQETYTNNHRLFSSFCFVVPKFWSHYINVCVSPQVKCKIWKGYGHSPLVNKPSAVSQAMKVSKL